MKKQHLILIIITTAFLLSNVNLAYGIDDFPSNPPVKSPPFSLCLVSQTENFLTLRFNQSIGNVNVSIANTANAMCFETTINASTGTSIIIDTNTWTCDTYYIAVTNENDNPIYSTRIDIP